MAGMAVSAATGVMSSLLSKLSVLPSDHYKQLHRVKRNIEFFSRELTEMNAALEKLAEMEKLEDQKRDWRNNVREMAYDIEDCIDITMYRIIEDCIDITMYRIGQGDDKDDPLHKITSKIKELRERHQIASKIRELKACVVEGSERSDRYKIDDSDPAVVEVDPRLPALCGEAKGLVGIDGPREEISRWLMEGDDNNVLPQLKVLSIVGFGGLGKTTLANLVRSKIKTRFRCTAFVSVSRNPDLHKVLKDILLGVGYNRVQMLDDEQKLILALREHLADKRYLIVIDDIWSNKAWDTIKCAFVENNKGSRVITTTRIQDVAAFCCLNCHGRVYQMKPLNENDSRRLFSQRVFNTEDGCPKQYMNISEDMLKKCKGVPLAITSISSLLASQSMHIQKWARILNSLVSELEANPTQNWMNHVLNVCYNDLSHDLKTCLLYLGTYPEDRQITKHDFVRRWIAEGFVSEKHGFDLEEVAENNFNELINRSMIQPGRSDSYGELYDCQVHDLMLDLIISKLREENFVTVMDGQCDKKGAPQARRICLQSDNVNMDGAVESMTLSPARSYVSFPAADYVPPLSKFELLRVLELERPWWYTECIDLSTVNHLFLLRYLKMVRFCLKLPWKFGKLQHLMTLDISECLLSGDPSTDVTSLSSLRHLLLADRIELRSGLSGVCDLRTLAYFDIGSNSVESIRSLRELTNLKELKPTYADNEEELSTLKYDALNASLCKLVNSNLRTLDFNGFAPSEKLWRCYFTQLLQLRCLRLWAVRIRHIPRWLPQAHRLTYFGSPIVKELRSDDIQVLAQMPCLKYLCLQTNKATPLDSFIMHSSSFPSLKEFRLFNFYLTRMTIEPGAMPCLQSLTIECGEPEGSSVVGIEHLANLEEIYLGIRATRGQRFKIESSWRDAIQRNPRSRSIKIHIQN